MQQTSYIIEEAFVIRNTSTVLLNPDNTWYPDEIYEYRRERKKKSGKYNLRYIDPD